MKPKVKITVLKREFYPDLVEQYVAKPGVSKCPRYEDGQSFIITEENYRNFPAENSFCPFAWDILKMKVYSALNGGKLFFDGWSKDPNKIVISCDDGVRPVIFLLEKIEE